MSSSHPYAQPTEADYANYSPINFPPSTSSAIHRPPRQPLPALPTGVPAQPQLTTSPPISPPADYARLSTRSRGESSPTVGAPRPGAAEALADVTRRRSTGPSGGVRRHITADGREETREERRERKERERQLRAQMASTAISSPTTASFAHQIQNPNRLPDPMSPDQMTSPTLPPSSGGASGHSRGGSGSQPATSSKSVLTIALQRAQSAVLLDSANNVPAAIAAYGQSVRLLKEVMARVEEGTRRERDKEAERERRREDGIDPPETDDERRTRLAKLERKERAKEDEARRLKVIHDTYQDRIKMLVTMNNPQPGADQPHADSLPASPNSASTAQPSPTMATAFVLPGTAQRQRNERTITSLGTTSTAPASFDGRHSEPPQLPPVALSPTREAHSSSDLLGAEGIGSAMLMSSPPASPMDPALPNLTRRPPAIDHLATVDSQGSITPRANPSPDAVTATNGFHPSIEQPALDWQSQSPSQLFTPPHSASPDESKLPSIELSQEQIRAQRDRSQSNASSTDGDVVPVTALEYDPSWPTGSSPNMGHPATFAPLELDERVARSGIGMALGGTLASEAMRPTASTDSSATLNGALMARLGSGESMARQPSGESFISVKGHSLFGAGGFQGLTQASPPTSHEFGATGGRPRPTRSASLATPATSAQPISGPPNGRGPSLSLGGKRPALVSATTTMGTISQRRKPTDMAQAESQQSVEVLHDSLVEETAEDDTVKIGPGVVSGSWSSPHEFGHASSSSLGGGTSSGYSSASLPMRLRALSQPGKRPPFPTYESERPALPPLALQANRSVSGPSFARKNSVPTPTSLTAPALPQLGRTNSGSSVGSEVRPYSHGSPALSSVGLPPGAATPVMESFGPRNGGAYTMSLPPPPHGQLGLDGQMSAVRRPFHLMQLLVLSIEGKGAYLSAKLYVPRQIWSQSGVKLAAVETKVRMLDLLLTGLEGVDKAGAGMLPLAAGGYDWEGYRAEPGSAGRLMRELESLEGLMDGIHSTLAKKLGFAHKDSAKKGSTAFSAWSNKLSRSLDRVTNGRSLDSPAVYVDAIAKVFKQAQAIDRHLHSLIEAEAGYADLSETEKRQIEGRLRRTSDFFSATVIRFVLSDVGLLIDKYVKRSATWVSSDATMGEVAR